MILEDNTIDRRLFNIELLTLKPQAIQLIGEIKSLTVFEPHSKRFEPTGLFSTDIFGVMGSNTRKTTLGYIDLKLEILHPLVYQTIVELKGTYGDILAGKAYATFDNNIKDFIPATADTGNTGYAFFMKHLPNINFKKTESEKRDVSIKFVTKYMKPEYRINKWLVLPAGLRDYAVDDNGIPSEDEINPIYRQLLMNANMVSNIKVTAETEHMLDTVRHRIQLLTLTIYKYIMTLLDGKRKFIQGVWTKRALTYGTRNVITPTIPTITDMDVDTGIGQNDTVIGVYQLAASLSPVTKNRIHSVFISKVLNANDVSANLIDPITLKSITVDLSVNKRNEWLTLEGLDGIINKLKYENVRLTPAKIDKYYVALVYDTGRNIEIIFNTTTLDETYDLKKLRPITYLELIFVAIAPVCRKYPGLLTRYPVIALGGIYASFPYLRATTVGRDVLVSVQGEPPFSTKEYPDLTADVYTSMSIHYSKLARAGGDHDGDKLSYNPLFTNESIEEVNKVLNSVENYVTPIGGIIDSVSITPINLVLQYMTGTVNG